MPTPVAENKAEHARPVVRPAALPPWPLGTSVPRAQALRRCPEHLFRSVGRQSSVVMLHRWSDVQPERMFTMQVIRS